MKIVLNKCYGGFSLSEAALKLGRALAKDEHWAMDADLDGEAYDDAGRSLDRTDPVLVYVVAILGSKNASGLSAKLEIRHIPHGDKYRIREHDGSEWIEFPGDCHWETADGDDQRIWELEQFEEGKAATKRVDAAFEKYAHDHMLERAVELRLADIVEKKENE